MTWPRCAMWAGVGHRRCLCGGRSRSATCISTAAWRLSVRPALQPAGPRRSTGRRRRAPGNRRARHATVGTVRRCGPPWSQRPHPNHGVSPISPSNDACCGPGRSLANRAISGQDWDEAVVLKCVGSALLAIADLIKVVGNVTGGLSLASERSGKLGSRQLTARVERADEVVRYFPNRESGSVSGFPVRIEFSGSKETHLAATRLNDAGTNQAVDAGVLRFESCSATPNSASAKPC